MRPASSQRARISATTGARGGASSTNHCSRSVVAMIYGTDPSATVSAFEAGELHANFETTADYVSILDGMDLVKSEVVTASTIVCRTNVTRAPYDDQKVRQALQLACDNAAVLQLGYGNAGTVAEYHHVCPIHPENYELPKIQRDPAKAKALLEEAGQASFEHELITVDEDWQRNTGDAIAEKWRDAGIKVGSEQELFPATR